MSLKNADIFGSITQKTPHKKWTQVSGARLKSSGALEMLVGKGKAGKAWGEVVRRVAQVRGGRVDAMDRTVRAGAQQRVIQ